MDEGFEDTTKMVDDFELIEKNLETSKHKMEEFRRNIKMLNILCKYRKHKLFLLELRYQQNRLRGGFDFNDLGDSYIEYFNQKEAPVMILKIHFVLFFLTFWFLNLNRLKNKS